MIDVLYFGSFREKLNCARENLEFTTDGMTVKNLMTQLAARSGVWADVFNADKRVLVAVNQEMAKSDTIINDQDEVGFFPPVTGG